MLFKQNFLDGIASGKITLAFRKWAKPRAVAGTLRTGVGVLSIDAVEVVPQSSITESHARQAGYASLDELRDELNSYEGKVYRIKLHLAGPDPRIKLREDAALSSDDMDEIRGRLDRLDRFSRVGPWTAKVLKLTQTHHGMPAGDMAAKLHLEKQWLKLNVRKLKELGLTESLMPGYRLSPRGEKVVRTLIGGPYTRRNH
jgi:hypothetical protein